MKPVVIIGGGFAGIASAARLAEKGRPTVLIERAPRLGGRAASFFHSRMNEEVDYGQHVLMRCCDRTSYLLKLLGQEDAVSFQPSLHVTMSSREHRDKIASAPLPGILHLLPSLLSYGLLSMTARMRVLVAALSLMIRDPGEISFGKWLSSHGQQREEIEALWDPICVATLNAHTENVSARAARLVFQRGFFRRHGADIGLFKRPLSQILDSIVPFLEAHDGRTVLRTTVKRIIVNADGVCGVETSDGEVIESDAIVSSVSIPDLPDLLTGHPAGLQLIERLSAIKYAPIVNVHLWFDRSTMDESFIICTGSPVQAIFDVSRAHRENGRHHIVVSQSAADDWIDMPVGKIVDAILAELARLLPRTQDAGLIDSLVIKSRSATIVPEVSVDAMRPVSTTPIKGLFLAGDYTATGWPSTIEGAVRSGFLAATRVLER